MTRQIFIIITTLVLEVLLLILCELMHWETYTMIVKICVPSFLFLMMCLSLNDNILNWLCEPMFKIKRKNNIKNGTSKV